MEYSDEDYTLLKSALIKAESMCTPDLYQARLNQLCLATTRFLLTPYYERQKNPMSEYESVLKMSEARNKVAEEQIKESERRINLEIKKNSYDEYINSFHDEERDGLIEFIKGKNIRYNIFKIIEDWENLSTSGDKHLDISVVVNRIMDYLKAVNGS